MYQLKIYDNFNYMDESATYLHGRYGSYEEALEKAQAIVEEHIIHNYKPGMTVADMTANYTMFGEDPVIICDSPKKDNRNFSAWTYADEFAKKYYEQKTKKQ